MSASRDEDEVTDGDEDDAGVKARDTDQEEVADLDDLSVVSVVSFVELLDTPPSGTPIPIAPKTERTDAVTPPPPPPPPPRTPRLRQEAAPKAANATTRAAEALAAGQPDTSSVVDRARAAVDSPRRREERIRRSLDEVSTRDPASAALLHIELGELAERYWDDLPAAEEQYRKAVALDPTLRAASWALRRLLAAQERWSECLPVITAELNHRDLDTEYRAELLFEYAAVASLVGSEQRLIRTVLDEAIQCAPRHHGTLLARHRELVATSEVRPLVTTLRELGRLERDPDRASGYLLESTRLALATGSLDEARDACFSAQELAESCNPSVRDAITRMSLRVIEAGAPADEDITALERVTQRRARVSPSKLAPMLRRQARALRTTRPDEAWDILHSAIQFLPNETVLRADAIELAVVLGKFKHLLSLVSDWRNLASEAERRDQITIWCAEAHRSSDRQFVARSLLSTVAVAAPGFILLTIAAEGRAIADAAPEAEALATTYAEAARAAALGTWLGAGRPPQPDRQAAASWNLQAAEILAYQVGSPAAIALARDLIHQAKEQAPGDPVMAEALIDLDESHGRPAQAIALLTGDGASASDLARAAMIASFHDLGDDLVRVEKRLIKATPKDARLLWHHEATLARIGDEEARTRVLAQLCETESDPDRRALAATLALIRAWRMSPTSNATVELAAELAALSPDDEVARDVHLELLRSNERWDDVANTLAQLVADAPEKGPSHERHMRELAWIREVRQNDAGAAADVYERWVADSPKDRTALEGLARCRSALRDPQRESVVRATLVEIDPSVDALWSLARSYERCGRAELALQHYRRILDQPTWTVAVAHAALAAADIAAAAGDLDARTHATAAIADRTTDQKLGRALHESTGWYQLLGVLDPTSAAVSFARANTPGAKLGTLLATDQGQAGRDEVLVELASGVEEDRALRSALLVRASLHARVVGDASRAFAHLEAAYTASPDDDHVLLRLCDAAIPSTLLGDPFSLENFTSLATAVARRAELAAPQHRAFWQLERAAMLEQADELQAAVDVVYGVLAESPTDRRALEALRRLAHLAGDQSLEAQTCWLLAETYRDSTTRLALLRTAARIYDGSAANHVGFAITVYRKIAELDSAAPELERLLALLGEASSQVGLLKVLSEQVDRLSASRDNDRRLVSLLVMRGEALHESGRTEEAIADLNCALEYTTDPADIRLRLSRIRGVARTAPQSVAAADTAPQPIVASDLDASTFTGADSEITDAQPLVDSLDAATPPPAPADPFGGTTARADISELQRAEREIATRASQLLQSRTITKRDDEFAPVPTVGDTPSKIGRAAPPRPATTTGDRTPAKLQLDGFWIELEPSLEQRPLKIAARANEVMPDLSAAVVVQRQPTHAERDPRDQLQMYEREIALCTDDNARASLHHDAGRAALAVEDAERAAAHFEAARTVASSPFAALAIRALRRWAVARGAMGDAAQLVATEIATAAPREQRALSRHLGDLWLAAGEYGHATGVVEELRDAQSPFARCLVLLEAAVAERDSARIASVLEQALAAAPAPLRDSLQFARGVVALQRRDMTDADRWFPLTSSSDLSLVRLDAIRHTALQGEAEIAGAALLELAHHVELDDPTTAAALALRAQSWMSGSRTEMIKQSVATAGELALRAMPRDPLVCRVVAEHALATESAEAASHAFVRLVRAGSSVEERAYAAGRAAELAPERLGRLWSQVITLGGPNDYAAARLHQTFTLNDNTDVSALVKLVSGDTQSTGRVAPLLRATYELRAQGDFERARDLLDGAPRSSPLVVMTLAGLLSDLDDDAACADLLTQTVSARPALASVLLARVAECRSTIARTIGMEKTDTKRAPSLRKAFDSWVAVLEHDPRIPRALTESLHLSTELGDVALFGLALARARAVAPSPAAAQSLVLRHVRALAAQQPKLALKIALTAASSNDPRATALAVFLAARRADYPALTRALEERHRVLADEGSATIELVQLRLRAAHSLLGHDEHARARVHLDAVAEALPGIDLVDELVDFVRDRMGEERIVRSNAGFVRLLYAGERSLESGDVQRAAEIYWCALLSRPSPLAAEPFVRFARMARMHAPLRAYAQQEVSTAQASGDVTELAVALEILADACDDPLGDPVTRTSLLKLRELDKARSDYAVRLEQTHAAAGDSTGIVAVRRATLDTASSAELIDTAVLALATGATLRDVADWIERAAAEPACSLLALRLADATCATDAPDDLVGIARRAADRVDQPASGAVFLARAAKVLAETDQAAAVPVAMAAFDLFAKHPITETARHIALASAQWPELLRVAQAEASLVAGAEAARHHHVAAVVAMDKLGDMDVALTELRATLALDPLTIDALLRLRLVADGDDPALVNDALLGALAEEPAAAIKVELHRMLAEHAAANGDYERAAAEYQTVLSLVPNEPRAVAALHDLESEVRKEGTLAAIEARFPVERDAFVLASLLRRLASAIAPREPQAASQTLRRALAHRRDDERALRQLIDIALAHGDARGAMSSCDALVALPLPRKRRVAASLRAAEVYLGLKNADAADDAIASALNAAVSLADTLKQVIKLFGHDRSRLMPHVDRVTSLARQRLERDVRDADAARALALASDTLAGAVRAPIPYRRTAWFARELVEVLGESTTDLATLREVEVDPRSLADPGLERVLLAGIKESALLEILRNSANALTARSDADLARYGITKRDALRKSHASVKLVHAVAQPLGFEDVAVYVSRRYAHAMIIEPTQPLSLVLGHEIARGSAADIRFAAGASLKLAQLGLAIPARMSLAELTLTIASVVYLKAPDVAVIELEPEVVARESAAFDRADPALRGSLAMRPGLAADALTQAHVIELARDLKVLGIKAGLVASGSLGRTLAILSGAIRTDVAGILADPVTRRVIGFALNELTLP